MGTILDNRNLACHLTLKNWLLLHTLTYLECVVKSHILTNLYSSILLLFSTKIKEEFTSDEADETSNSLAKNSQNPPSSNLSPGQFSDADWDDKDDVCFLEATEDAEFADAADKSLLGYKSAMDDIPDELIVEALQSS